MRAKGSALRYASMAAMVLAASLALAMAVACGGAPGRWLGAVAVGLLFAGAYRTWREAAVLSAIAGVLGPVLANASAASGRSVVPREGLATFSAIYLQHLVDANSSMFAPPVLYVGLIALTAVVVALLVALAIQHSPDRKLARVLAASLVVACTFGSMWFGLTSADMNKRLHEPNEAGKYRQDAVIYWKTYLNLTLGEPFYQSFQDAAAGDELLIDNHDIVNGKFVGWAYSPASIRLPYAFYLWRYTAPRGGGQLLVVSLLFAGVVLSASLWALVPRVGPAAALVPMLLMPYLQVSLGLGGLFMPDVWAGLFVTLGFFAWIRERYIVAGALMLAGALCRETAIFALLILLAWAAWRALRREREWVVRTIALTGMAVVFALAYWLHLRAGSPYVVSSLSPGGTVAKMLRLSAERPFSERFLAPAEFGFLIYLLLLVPSWLPLALQFPGWWVTLRSSHDASVPVLAHSVFWVLFALTLGMSAAYWGALYMPLAITGSAALLAWAGMRGQHVSGSTGPVRRSTTSQRGSER